MYRVFPAIDFFVIGAQHDRESQRRGVESMLIYGFLPKEFDGPCLHSISGQVAELKLAQKLAFTAANAFLVLSTNSNKGALSAKCHEV